ncbi:MAG: ATP-binding protein [Oscillospiraceae bacterium]
MAKVILICGKISSGKTRYARLLMKTKPAVLLSSDEITLALFGSNGGQEHGMVVDKLQDYLYRKSLEITGAGIDVILDWGFWTQNDRQQAAAFYTEHKVAFEWHYIDTAEEALRANLSKRNREIAQGLTQAYCFSDDLIAGFWDMFEVPAKSEMNVWIENKLV